MGMRETFENFEKVKPIAEKNGTKIVSYEDAKALNDMEMYERTPDTGDRTFNPDGSLARTRVLTSAINPENRFNNRYRIKGKIGDRKMQVVVDYRALKEQSSGQVYLKNIPCYEIARDEDGNLKLEKVFTVSDTEFISDFTDKLSVEVMKQVAPLIEEHGADISTTNAMPI